MELSSSPVLIVPGWNGSPAGHWQTLWEERHSGLVRVEQRDWVEPDARDWIDTLAGAIAAAPGAPVLVAHSLGCIAVALLAERRRAVANRVKGALLVAPPGLDPIACPPALRSFLPVPRRRLPFRSVLVASENDPYATLAAARGLAGAWGSRFVNEGPVGHINCASGFGEWPGGEMHLEDLLTACRASEAA
jgi:uncharacterized protein